MHKPSLIMALVMVLVVLICCAEGAKKIDNFFIPEEAALRRTHKTHNFRSQTWYILRRAEAINFQIQLDEELNSGQTMSFQIAPYSILDNRSIKLNHVSGGTYTIQARLMDDAPVGIFSIGLRLSDSTTVRQLPKQVAVLFNPWSEATDEYFPRPAELSEYVDQEHGITYRGSSHQVQDVRWYLGQFTQEALTVTLYFVNRLNDTERRDPALVVRHLTRSYGMQETVPDGLMEGKWEGGYGGGTNPNSWGSSDQIFRTYIQQGFRPVRYAQCWVFGAVLLSSLRTLGLASNQVSVMDSAHEYAAERTGIYMARVGKYYEENYRYNVATSAKIWNFHSFNLVFLMNRHADWPYNLPDWNVVDATPQEHSVEGDFRLGPAPLKAVREWKKANKFDTPFVISEVSARDHSFLVKCSYGAFGGGQRLPPGCKVTKDLGAAAHASAGTYIVAKAVSSFNQQPWTHMFHTRAKAPAEDPSLSRFNAVRAFDTLSTTTGAIGGRRMPTTVIDDSFDEVKRQVSDKHEFDEDSSDLLFALHTEDEVDMESVFGPNGEVSLHQSDKTGVAMSIVIPPIELGKPLEVFLNFACEGQTASFKDQLRRTDLTTKVVTLEVNALKDKVVTDEDGDATTSAYANTIATTTTPVDIIDCPAIAAVSFRLDLQLTDYRTHEIGKIADIEGQIVLKQHNGYFESYRIVVNDYVGKALEQSQSNLETIPEYVRAIVVATDHSTDPDHDIIMVAERNSMINMPKVLLTPSQTNFIISRALPNTAITTDTTIYTASTSPSSNGATPQPLKPLAQPNNNGVLKTTYPAEVLISYFNQLPFDLTNVSLSISADNLGFEGHLVKIGTVKAGMKLAHTHTFNVFEALDGLHYYTVIMSSDQLTPTHAAVDFLINHEKKI